MDVTIYFYLWIGCILAALIISRKASGFWLGVLLGPVGVLLIILLGKRCPYCKSWIKRDAVTCPKCTKDLKEK